MTPFDFSSGDPLADRRADYAEQLLAAGDPVAAADLMAQALELAPLWTAGWFRLGEMAEQAGDTEQSVLAWRKALATDASDRFGATLKLELAGVAAADGTMPPAFVETLFDQYADTFEEALVEKLDYRVPDLLAEAIARSGRTRFDRVLDLGCGTGLMGERLRACAGVLSGCDLSTEMLRVAEGKALYDHLFQANINELPVPPHPGHDLVTAADVFMYLGDLEPVFAWAGSAVRPEGLFAFSVESLAGRGDFMLRETRRYAHAAAYVDRQLLAHGFKLLSRTAAVIRKDRDTPVEGLVIVASRAV